MTLACLDMMEFKGKDKMYRTVQNMLMQYQAMMMQQQAVVAQQGGGVSGTKDKTAEAEERADKKQAEAKASAVGGVTPND